MKLINTYKNANIIISEELLEKLSKYGIEQFPNEFGGFLMGHYSSDYKSLTITDTILPKKYKGTPCLFQRSIHGIDDLFDEYYNKEPKQYYVGEWHTHPNGPTQYSQTDLCAMITIANCETVHITNPILLILSVNKLKMNSFQFYLYNDKKLFPFV